MSRRFKPYPSYKNCGVRWLEKMPEGWCGLPLKRWVETKITDGPHETPEFQPEGVDFISAEAVQNSRIDFNLRRGFISQTLHHQYCQKCRPIKNDILLCKSGATTGKLAIVDTGAEFSIWSPLAIIRTDTSRIIPRFAFWSLQSDYVQNQIRMTWSAGTQPNIAMSALEVLYLTGPSLVTEQHAIVSFLDRETGKIDALVKKKERLIELLQEKRTALISHTVTQGLNPNVPKKDSGISWLRKIPSHWELKKLKYLASNGSDMGIQIGPFGGMLTGLSYDDDGEFKVYGQENTLSSDFSKGQRWLTRDQFLTLSNYHIASGDILFTRKGSIGGCTIVPVDVKPGIIDSDTIRLRIKRAAVNTKFILYAFKFSAYLQAQVQEIKRGAILSGLNTTTIANLFFIVPPIAEQAAIVDYLDQETVKLDILIAKVQLAIERLQEYRTALISAAVTGQIDVRKESQS